jgi:hypothetical protein
MVIVRVGEGTTLAQVVHYPVKMEIGDEESVRGMKNSKVREN